MSAQLHDNVVPEHVSAELVALAQLLAAWAQPEATQRRSDQWEQRLPALRHAVVSGLKHGPGRVREDVPHELVADEVSIAAAMIDWLLDKSNAVTALDESSVCSLRIGDDCESVTVEKGLPASTQLLNQIRHGVTAMPGPGRPPRDELIGLIVAARLPIKGDTATKAPGRSRTFGKEVRVRPLQHRLLANLYLDLAWSSRRPDLQASALDALLADGYHVLMLYYLVQLAHCPPAARVETIDDEGIGALCKLVGRNKSGPFAVACGSK